MYISRIASDKVWVVNYFHFLVQDCSNPVLSRSLLRSKIFTPRKKSFSELNNKTCLFSFYNNIRQQSINYRHAMSASNTPLMTYEFSPTSRNNLIPCRVAKSFFKKLNWLPVSHSNLYHRFIINEFSLPASPYRNATFSIYQTGKIRKNKIHITKLPYKNRNSQREEAG